MVESWHILGGGEVSLLMHQQTSVYGNVTNNDSYGGGLRVASEVREMSTLQEMYLRLTQFWTP